MKINPSDRFPHPVLEDATDDYLTGEFTVNVHLAESMKTGALLVHYDVEITEPSLSECMANGLAQACLFITCLETYYNVLHRLELSRGQMEIPQGLLSGTVIIRPMVIASHANIRISSTNWHGDFRGVTFHPEAGEILALGSQVRFNVGREKLAPIESIFELAVGDGVPKGQFQVGLDSERITIVAEKDTYEAVYNIRNVPLGRHILLNSVYLPAVMQVLSVLQDGSGSYQERRWYRVFTAKCTLDGIDTQNPDLLGDAQKLLKSPLTRVITVMEKNS